MRALSALAITIAASLFCLNGAVGAVGAASNATVTPVVSGLDNPRDLAFGPNGKLYVAEAGHGGLAADCVGGGEQGTTCFGLTSAVSIVQTGSFHRVVSGLASLSDVGGFAATGIDGISFKGNNGYAIEAASRDIVPSHLASDIDGRLRRQLGRLIKFTPSGRWSAVGDVGHRDFSWTREHSDLVPGQFPDANPYGVLALEGSRWVVDAGANTVDRVWPNGTVAIAEFIPNPPATDAVPTCIDRGPDGAFYIGQLTGGGNPPGSASVWRFAPGTAHPLTKWATGLTAVTGCGFGHDGNFYATEFSTLGLENSAPGTGALVRVPAHSSTPVTVAGGLSFPGGFAPGSDGSLYVSNWSIAPAATGLGSVLRIVPST